MQHMFGVTQHRSMLSRRGFLAWATGAIGGFLSAAMAVPLVGFFLSPALKKSEKAWVPLGRVEDFEKGKPVVVEFSQFIKDGWVEESVKRAAWVIRDEQGISKVWNPKCTHLGCAIYWDPADRKLKSPCHGGVFDPVDGRVLAGPPPRPLDTMPFKVEGGRLMIQYVDYKLGVPEKAEL